MESQYIVHVLHKEVEWLYFEEVDLKNRQAQ